MKVRLVKFKSEEDNGLTIGKVYYADGIDQTAAYIIEDDSGEPSCLYTGEYEVVNEQEE